MIMSFSVFIGLVVDAGCFGVPLDLITGTVGDYTVRKLQHDGSHHLIVLMAEDVAVVDEPWILPQLVRWDIEVLIPVPFLPVV